MPENPAPYLSLVVTARNDDHGGNLLGRMQIFVSGWIEQAKRHGIPSELIIVEWNPPPDRPTLAEALEWPDNPEPCKIRLIEVPPELHRAYAHSEALPLYQMIAKNVGIRRAHGKHILATNIDILVSNELAAFLGQQKLRAGRMYRIDRFDAMSDVPVKGTLDEKLAYCGAHLIRINTREGTFAVTPEGGPVLSPSDIASKDCGILFGRGWFAAERYGKQEVFRWGGEEAEILLGARPPGAKVLVLDIEPGPMKDSAPVGLEVIGGTGEALASATIRKRSKLRLPLAGSGPDRIRLCATGGPAVIAPDPRPVRFRVFRIGWEERSLRQAELRPMGPIGHAVRAWRAIQHLITRFAEDGPLVRLTVISPRALQHLCRAYVRSGGVTGVLRGTGGSVSANSGSRPPEPPDFLHTNACGDFTLMAREHWFDLRAYPEADLFSMNLDSLFCFAAHYGGAPEEILPEPMRIYHVEHGTGSGWTPEGQAKLFARIASRGLTFINNDDVLTLAGHMRTLNSPMIFNHEDWGLANHDLKETLIGRRP